MARNKGNISNMGHQQKYNALLNEKNDIMEKYNILLSEYNTTQDELDNLLRSFAYRLALKIWKIGYKFNLVSLYRGIKYYKNNGITKTINKLKTDKVATQLKNARLPDKEKAIILEIKNDKNNKDENTEIIADESENEEARARNHWNYYRALYAQTISGQNAVTDEISKLITGNYKGIVVYPQCVHWEPCQRPQHLLRGFANKGFLCFFCENRSEGATIKEVSKNLYIVYGEEYLVPALLDQAPIVLISYFLQYNFASYIKHSAIWFDVLDRPDFFDLGKTKYSREIISTILEKADIITYSGELLYEFVCSRNDAIYLPNAVYPKDFSVHTVKHIAELDNIKKEGKKIVGYFGAIEKWFDLYAIKSIIDNTNYEIVLIGHVNIDGEILKNRHVHALGIVPYQELPAYAAYFDAALIPFVVNSLTDCVSPVKFFEYLALGLPVVSSAIHEMLQYEDRGCYIYRDVSELPDKLGKAMRCNTEPFASNIIKENTWEKRVQKVENRLYRTINGLKSLASVSKDKGISLFSVSFFDYDGANYFSGGAERYLIDLDQVCKELDIHFRIYQYARYDWIRFYNNIEVIGLSAESNSVDEYTEYLMHEMSEKYLRSINGHELLSIYSPFYLMDRKSNSDSIGISHGISWDNEASNYTDGNTFWRRNKRIIESVNYCNSIVSVDTNTCNWFQTINFDKAKLMQYVPNYVDLNVFRKRLECRKKGKIVITYPRRLYAARGLYLVLDVMDSILKKYNNVEFHFVGKGFEEDTKHVQAKIKQWGERVQWYFKAPDEMYSVYAYTDIALVPTINSEGTSLSCLEAMSSGNAVIVTRVGGLTNLVINRFNGIMIEPNAESLKLAICDLIDNPSKREEIQNNAIETASCFSKNRWIAEWKDIISNRIKDESSPYKFATKCRINLEDNCRVLDDDVTALIKQHLEKGEYVYVSIPHNKYCYMSYGRLQFISSDDEIYFTANVSIDI